MPHDFAPKRPRTTSKRLLARPSLVEEVAEWLRQKIRAGTFDGPLPSHRALRTQLQVGRSTVQAAFAILRKEGTIALEPRKRAVSRQPRNAAWQDKVVWLDWDLNQNFSSRRQFDVLFFQTMIQGRGYDFELKISNAVADRHRVRNDVLLFDHPKVHCWVLANQPPEIQRRVEGEGRRAVIVGSRAPGVGIPWIDLNWRAVARHAGGTALARGHRRIAFFCSRGETADHEEAVFGVREAFEPHEDDPGAALDVIRHDETRRGIVAAVRGLFLRETPRPTVLIVKEAYTAITVFSTLLSQFRLRLPKECSLVCLEDDLALTRTEPPVSRYGFGGQVLWRQLLSVVSRIERLDGAYRFEIQPSPVEGETFGASGPV